MKNPVINHPVLFDNRTVEFLNTQKSSIGATGSIKKSMININIEPRIIDIILFPFERKLDMLPEIVVRITQFIPIKKGTPNNFGPRFFPYEYSPNNKP